MKKESIIILAAAAAAFYVITRRNTVNGSLLVPSTAGATLAQQAADAARNNSIINALGSVGGWLTSGLGNSVVTPEARAAVRAGDPYYTSGDNVGGTDANSWFEQVAVDTAAWTQAGYNNAPSGDPYNPDGYYAQGLQ